MGGGSTASISLDIRRPDHLRVTVYFVFEKRREFLRCAADRVGGEGATIRMQLAGEAGAGRLKAVMFRAREGAVAEALLARDGATLHVAGHLRAEAWNGAVAPGFVIADVTAA